MSQVGTVFEIREFSLFDGPGVRTTVFLKGCPLRCDWCHNPEGINPNPELLFIVKNCVGCGACRKICPRRGNEPCRACGRCAAVCANRARRLCGKRMTSDELTAELLKLNDFFAQNPESGVTFSGGEPLSQTDFVVETAKRLRSAKISTAVETSGFADPKTYLRMIEAVDYVFQDIKHPDKTVHQWVTGVSNRPILDNLAQLMSANKPFTIRVPIVPSVNDDISTMEKIAALLINTKNLQRVELLTYHAAGRVKYAQLDIQAPQVFKEKPVSPDLTDPFTARNLPVRIL